MLYIVASMLSSSISAGDAAAIVCPGDEVVELYPGYPGYQGYVAGLVGEHETSCLEDLEDRDSSFSKRREDRENLEAADDLGIRGDIEDFTWENWMAIEAERGLPPVCYYCLIADASNIPTSIIHGDSRTEMGWSGQKAFADEYFRDSQNSRGLVSMAPTDDQLRALAGLFADGDLLNAPQTIDMMEEVLDSLFTPGQHIDPSGLWDTLISQGGYVPAPDDIAPPDQLFLVFAGFFAVSPYMTETGAIGVANQLEQASQEWQDELLQDRGVPSFGEYLRDAGAARWL